MAQPKTTKHKDKDKKMFDLSKYADSIQNAAEVRQDREWISEGKHLVRITGVECINSSAHNKDFFILEGEIVSSDVIPQGENVKHMLALSGIPQWKLDLNFAELKSIIVAAGGVTDDLLAEGLRNPAVAVGAVVNCRVKGCISKNQKTFKRYTWSAPANTHTQPLETSPTTGEIIPF